MPAALISLIVGLLSLGAETLWVRTYAYASQSTSTAFTTVLSVYLLGITVGAALGGKLCRTSDKLREIVACCILAGSAVVAFSPAAIIALPNSKGLLLLLIFLPAFLMSVCFPICHHLGTQLGTGRVGKSLSRVYAANILGSMLGPLIANFVVLQFVTTQAAFVIFGTVGMAVALALAFADRAEPILKHGALAGTVGGVGLLFMIPSAQVSAGNQNQLVMKLAAINDEARYVVETRQGILTAHKDDEQGDAIFGANVYDGRTNLDPRINSNGLNRILILQAARPNPRRVLVVGLSIASWLHLIEGFPGVEHIDVVEINPGYITLASHYPAQAAAIKDPRVNLVIGDGRKFLRTNPNSKYDLVVMNTTWHWRMYSSLLLSREFLTMVKAHMAEGAAMTFNTTGSIDALKTAKTIFKHAYLYDNFVVASEFDWRPKLTAANATNHLRAIKPRGKPLFGANDGDVIADFLDPQRIQDLDAVEAKAGRRAEVITDRNLLTEYRYKDEN